MNKDIISEVVAKRLAERERLIKEAFLRHFGFPIDEADKNGLERLVFQREHLQEFRYMGEGFLLYDEDSEFKVESGEDRWTAVMTSKYRMI